MRSIRRSLLGYLLVLLAVALGAVCVLVDRFANAAIRQREESETKRIEHMFKVRQNEAKVQFDADILTQAKALIEPVRTHTKSIVGQQDFRRPGGPPPKSAEPQTISAVLKATEEEARQFRLRSALLEFAPGPSLFAAVAPVAAVEPILRGNDRWRHHPYPNWVEFETPWLLGRIQTALRKTYAEDHPTNLFQFTLVATHFGRPGRYMATVRSEQLAEDLPLDAAALEELSTTEPRPNPRDQNRTEQENKPKFEDVNIPGIGFSRQVVISTMPTRGWPIAFWIWLPSPPAPVNNPLHAVYPPSRGPDVNLRVFVHHARPYSELEARLAADQKDRDDQLTLVREETRIQLAELRVQLILIGAGTFAALVLGGWFIVARGLSPLRKLSDAVSCVSEKDFRLPVVPAELGHELAPIHARITQTLTLLQRAFAREKQAVADISHELRTPIASLLATIDVALRKPRTPDQYRTTLEECRLISKQLGQLVERIMTLASLDAGNDHFVVSRTEVSELLHGCAAVIRPLATTHSVSVLVQHDGELVLETDAGKVREVLMNLLHNAVEYNNPGGTIELTAKREGASAVLEVRDTGIGMSSEVKEKIFERFYRADASRTSTGVHAGLGLAIVKEYVELLHGSISVESKLGVGTVFRVMLPLASKTSEPASSLPSAPSERVPTHETITASS